MGQKENTYSFQGQVEPYDAFRPRWPVEFAKQTLAKAGISLKDGDIWLGTPNGQPPVVACIGAGTGADAATFKALGCKVILSEPNKEFLQRAGKNLEKIDVGEVVLVNGNAMHSGVTGPVDVVVVAQALHTMKAAFADKFKEDSDVESGLNAEELARSHWESFVPDDGRNRIAFWYYNPDPRLEMVRELHRILHENLPKYAASKTPLLNAEYFEPNHMQPWMKAEDMQVSNLAPVQTLSLRRDQIREWLSSYSFKPDADEELDRVVDILQREWFDRFSVDGQTLNLPYVGIVTQAKLRHDRFDMNLVNTPVNVTSPMHYELPRDEGTKLTPSVT